LINETLKPVWLKSLFIITFIITQTHYLNIRSHHDHKLGYIDEIETLQEIAQTAKENKWQDKIISADHFPALILTIPEAGYVSQEEVFKKENISYCAGKNYEIFIYYSTKWEETVCNKPDNIVLLKTIRHGHSGADIYKLTDKQ